MQPTPIIFLAQVQQGLARGTTPIELIDVLMPKTPLGAEEWIRCLPIFSGHQYLYSEQIVAIARIVAKRAMSEFSLKLTGDGRIVDTRQKCHRKTPEPSATFKLKLAGQELDVEYTSGYFPDGTDLYAFTSNKPHCLSNTGYWSKLVPDDVVEACGGVEAYAVLIAEAELKGESDELDAIFEGDSPDTRKPKTKKMPVVGQHTAQVVQQPSEAKPAVQKCMFD